MGKYVLLCDTGSEITPEFAKELGVELISFVVKYDDVEHYVYRDTGISLEDFYLNIKQGLYPYSRPLSKDEFKAAFREYLTDKKDIIYLCVARNSSKAYENAALAAKDLLEEFPDRRVKIIDTGTASVGETIVVVMAAREMQKGAEFEDFPEVIHDVLNNLHQWFFVDDINHLKRGGILSTAEPSAAVALKIRPILSIEDGRMVVKSRVRGTGNAENYLIERAVEASKGGLIVIAAAGNQERSERLKKMLCEKGVGDEYILLPMGMTTGTFLGPGAGGIAYL
ncbi:MAG: DegV family protein [Eubacterium sp.]|nr:DegV family protein [Eubacterium sp.]